MYERATTIMDARIGELRCDDATALARAWILAQAWFVNDFGVRSVYSASITSGVSFLDDASLVPVGEPRPDTAALLVPSGGTPEAFAAKHVNEQGRGISTRSISISRMQTPLGTSPSPMAST